MLSIWDWTTPEEAPIAETVLEGDSFQTCLKFHPEDPFQLVSNGHASVFFYSWSLDVAKIAQIVPELNAKEFNIPALQFTESVFLPSTTQAITGTASGEAVLWDQKSLSNISVTSNGGMRSAIKYIRLHNSSINTLTTAYQKFLITGGEEGSIRVFDMQVGPKFHSLPVPNADIVAETRHAT